MYVQTYYQIIIAIIKNNNVKPAISILNNIVVKYKTTVKDYNYETVTIQTHVHVATCLLCSIM